MATETKPECPMMAEPQDQHRWLQRFVGAWACEAECVMEPGKPPSKTKGTERVRPIGDLWILAEGEGEMPGGGTAKMLLTLGYDPARGCFVGTWVGSMMTHLWTYEGELDAAGKTLTLRTEGPSMTGEGTAKYEEVIELRSDDHRVWTSRVRGPDGEWTQIMTANYRRIR